MIASSSPAELLLRGVHHNFGRDVSSVLECPSGVGGRPEFQAGKAAFGSAAARFFSAAGDLGSMG